MNCRTVRMLAIAIGMCVVTATASNAMAAKNKGMHGTVSAITKPQDAKGSTAAVVGSIEITTIDKTTKAETKTSYPLSDSVSVTIDGNPDKIDNIAVGDKIGFKLDENKKVSVIMKGHKKKAPK